MAVERLKPILLRATSVADDLAFVALADIAKALEQEDEASYRIIGGQMVMVLAARWDLGADLYRVTLDADLGAPPVVVRDFALLERLVELGYEQVAGDRFAKPVDDIPAGDEGENQQAVIDILLPAYTSRPSRNKQAGEVIGTEVLGLAAALQRPPLAIELELQRLNGDELDIVLSFPDEAGALVLKAFATRARHKPTDHTDVWRCLEIAHASGVTTEAFTDSAEMSEGADLVRSLFADRHGPGMSAISEDQGLSETGADQQYTRIRALTDEILGA
jgi:hypothetical protein